MLVRPCNRVSGFRSYFQVFTASVLHIQLGCGGGFDLIEMQYQRVQFLFGDDEIVRAVFHILLL
jgi:hypothetical protein